MNLNRITPFVLEHATRAASYVLPGDVAADKALSSYFRDHPTLGAYERRFAAETVYSVIRNRRSLGEMAGSRTPRVLVLAALARFSGFNAREFEALVKPGEFDLIKRIKAARPEDLAPAVRLDLPDWLYARLVVDHGEAETEAYALAFKEAAPLDLRVNTIKANREDVLAALQEAGIEGAATVHSPAGIRLSGKPALAKNAQFLAGNIEVQDEGSQLLALLVNPKRTDMVADFCAGAGGKTLALGALMRSGGRLYAFDVSERRLKKFGPRLKRSGLSNVHPVRITSENDLKIKRLAGKMDRVLVDAPCSGLGTLRRNPELKWRQSETDIAELAVKQAAILAGAARLVKPGGRLVYATCSILRDENEAVVDGFLAVHGDFKLVNATDVLHKAGVELQIAAAAAVPADTAGVVTVAPPGHEACLRLSPHRHATDGFFAAVMERVKSPAGASTGAADAADAVDAEAAAAPAGSGSAPTEAGVAEKLARKAARAAEKKSAKAWAAKSKKPAGESEP